MADQQDVPDDRLPVPAGERLPEVRRAGIVPADPTRALARVAGAPLLAPLAAAAAVEATAAAMTEIVGRMMRPWLDAVRPGVPQPGSVEPGVSESAAERPPGTWFGPGVHVSYTHVEMHWPFGR